MIQFNLLPDVKLHYIKAERQKHMAISIAIITSIAAITILIFLALTVRVFQQKNMSDLDKDIKSATTELQNIKDLNKILTVQSQLGSLDTLHNDKPVSSRLYSYISQVTPSEASISNISVDFSTNTLEMSGKVSTLALVQKFADTLKFSTYKSEEKAKTDTSADPAAFADVVLSSFARQKEGANYTLKMSFDPAIFSNTKTVSITVPALVSTDAASVRPSPLFQPTAPVEGQ